MQSNDEALVSNRVMEAAVGGLVFAIGLLIVWDASRLGFGWADEGPQAGYFPFYTGLILCISSAIAIVQGVRARGSKDAFVERGQARQILAVLIPAIAYVIAVRLLGIYVASAIFIGAFMSWQGKFTPLKCIVVGLMVPICLFLMFEIWFKVPLPKGPLESLFGY